MPLARPTIFIPPQVTPYETIQLALRGGLRNNIPDEEIAENECSLVENYIPDLALSGLVIKREGLTTTSSVISDKITSVKQGKYANYFTDSTNIRAFAGTALDTGLTSSTDPDWVVYGGTGGGDIMCNGTEVRVSTNGTSFGALGGSPPAFKYMEAHNNFLWGAGHSGGILRWADIGTAATWTATNSLTITNNENDNITGLKKFNSVLKVFCRNSYYDVSGTGPNDISVLRAYYGVGCTSHRSIVVAPNFIAWWTDLGMAFSRSGTQDDLQFPFFEKIPGTLYYLNKNNYTLVHGNWNELEKRIEFYAFNGTNQTTCNIRLDYYYDEQGGQDSNGRPMGTCWVHTGTAANMGASGVALTSGVPTTYVGSAGSSSSYLYLQDPSATTDNGTSIAALAETKRDSTKYGPTSLKRLKHATLRTVATGSGTIALSYYLDDSDSIARTWNLAVTSSSGFVLDVDALDSGMLGAGDTSDDIPVAIPIRYRKIKFRIADSLVQRTRLRGIVQTGTLLGV